MNSFFNILNNPMLNILRTAQQIKQNPDMLATLLQQRGMISEQQVQDVKSMGGNFEQVSQYLMQNGKMPTDIKPYEGQINQMQQMLNK